MSTLDNLTDTERLILANQYEILSKLSDSQYEKDDYKQLSDNFRHGYKWLYKEHFQVVSDVLDDADTSLVVETLSLYRTLKNNYDDLTDKAGIDEHKITFLGFDGNNERRLMNFTKALKENNRFTEIIEKGLMNSHSPMRQKYQKMLNKWKELDKKETLTLEELIFITDY
ncbi:YfbU family protein [Acinetobacter rudis]|uniref:YfbU family protein n=1 Tax=Acinetobacter rudis TaxID=632955 RepID=UPI0028101066|nr:YfbU family protein [Acinetobacter rudis]MDQ8952182.1 YfbU family protein [Acinetobacter rudis]